MWERKVKNTDLFKCLNLNDYQFKTKYNYRSTYMNPITTTKSKYLLSDPVQKKLANLI